MMSTAPHSLARARSKRDLARELVQAAPGMSRAIDREALVKHAALLDEEAAKLEAEADSLQDNEEQP